MIMYAVWQIAHEISMHATCTHSAALHTSAAWSC